MAFPTAVNSQITDSVTPTTPNAPAVAMGNLFIATSQALANAAHNATTAQQQANVTMQAATTQAVATLLGLDAASTGVATNILR